MRSRARESSTSAYARSRRRTPATGSRARLDSNVRRLRRAGRGGGRRARRRVALGVLDLGVQLLLQLLVPVVEGLLLLGLQELRLDLRLERRVERLDAGRLDRAERLDQVVAELRLDGAADDALRDLEGGLVELGHRLALRDVAQVAALDGRRLVGRVLLGERPELLVRADQLLVELVGQGLLLDQDV